MIYSTYVQTCNIHNTYIIIYTLYKCTVNIYIYIYMIRYIYIYIVIYIYIYPYRSKCLLRKYWRYDSGGSAVPSQTVFGSQKRLYYAILVYLFILQDPIPAVLSPQDPVPALATSCPCRGNIRLIVQRRRGSWPRT